MLWSRRLRHNCMTANRTFLLNLVSTWACVAGFAHTHTPTSPQAQPSATTPAMATTSTRTRVYETPVSEPPARTSREAVRGATNAATPYQQPQVRVTIPAVTSHAHNAHGHIIDALNAIARPMGRPTSAVAFQQQRVGLIGQTDGDKDSFSTAPFVLSPTTPQDAPWQWSADVAHPQPVTTSSLPTDSSTPHRSASDLESLLRARFTDIERATAEEAELRRQLEMQERRLAQELHDRQQRIALLRRQLSSGGGDGGGGGGGDDDGDTDTADHDVGINMSSSTLPRLFSPRIADVPKWSGDIGNFHEFRLKLLAYISCVHGVNITDPAQLDGDDASLFSRYFLIGVREHAASQRLALLNKWTTDGISLYKHWLSKFTETRRTQLRSIRQELTALQYPTNGSSHAKRLDNMLGKVDQLRVRMLNYDDAFTDEELVLTIISALPSAPFVSVIHSVADCEDNYDAVVAELREFARVLDVCNGGKPNSGSNAALLTTTTTERRWCATCQREHPGKCWPRCSKCHKCDHLPNRPCRTTNDGSNAADGNNGNSKGSGRRGGNGNGGGGGGGKPKPRCNLCKGRACPGGVGCPKYVEIANKVKKDFPASFMAAADTAAPTAAAQSTSAPTAAQHRIDNAVLRPHPASAQVATLLASIASMAVTGNGFPLGGLPYMAYNNSMVAPPVDRRWLDPYPEWERDYLQCSYAPLDDTRFAIDSGTGGRIPIVANPNVLSNYRATAIGEFPDYRVGNGVLCPVIGVGSWYGQVLTTHGYMPVCLPQCFVVRGFEVNLVPEDCLTFTLGWYIRKHRDLQPDGVQIFTCNSTIADIDVDNAPQLELYRDAGIRWANVIPSPGSLSTNFAIPENNTVVSTLANYATTRAQAQRLLDDYRATSTSLPTEPSAPTTTPTDDDDTPIPHPSLATETAPPTTLPIRSPSHWSASIDQVRSAILTLDPTASIPPLVGDEFRYLLSLQDILRATRAAVPTTTPTEPTESPTTNRTTKRPIDRNDPFVRTRLQRLGLQPARICGGRRHQRSLPRLKRAPGGSPPSIWLQALHRYLGHPSLSRLARFAQYNNYSLSSTEYDWVCRTCARTRLTRRLRYAEPTVFMPSDPRVVVSGDWIPADTASIGGNVGAYLFVDWGSQFMASYPQPDKSSESFLRAFQQFLVDGGYQIGPARLGPLVLHTDTASEVFSAEVRDFCRRECIHMRCSAPGNQQQNGVAERAVRTIKSRTRAIMLDSQLQPRFWAHAMAFACTIENILPHDNTDVSDNRSAYERHFSTKPDPLAHIPAPFGTEAVCYDIQRTHNHSITDVAPHTFSGIYLGNSSRSRSFIVYSLDTGSIREVESIAFPTGEHHCEVGDDADGTDEGGAPDASRGGDTPPPTNDAEEDGHVSGISATDDDIVQALIAQCADSSPQCELDHLDGDNTDIPHCGYDLPTTADDFVSSIEYTAAYGSLLERHAAASVYSRVTDKATTGPLLNDPSTIDQELAFLHTMDPQPTRHDLPTLSLDSLRTLNDFTDTINPTVATDPPTVAPTAVHTDPPTVVPTAVHTDDQLESSCVGMLVEPPVASYITHTMYDSVPKARQDRLWDAYLKPALDSELASLAERNCWRLVPIEEAEGRRLINSKIIFAKKMDPTTGVIRKFKARLVARGFSQMAGIDFQPDSIYAPTPHDVTVRAVIATAVQRNMHLASADVSTAYLHANLHEKLFMRMPQGLRTFTNGSENVALLQKSLYGLKQSGANWSRELGRLMSLAGYRRAKHDTCLFTRFVDGKRSYCVTYVDDLLMAVDDPGEVDRLLKILSQHVAVTGGQALTEFLGMKATRDMTAGTLELSQQALIEELFDSTPELATFKSTAKVSVPLPTHLKGDVFHSNDQPAPGRENRAMQSLYRKCVGTLLYIAVKTRPDLQYAATRAATQMSNPGDAHWTALSQTLRYLWQTRDNPLTFRRDNSSSEFKLTAYSDANWAANPINRRSISGYFITLGASPILWKTKTQTVVATSSTDSETIAASLTAKSIAHAREVLTEMGIPHLAPTTLYVDNMAVQLASDQMQASPRLKHIEISNFYVADLQDRRVLHVLKINGTDNPADAFTKPLDGLLYRKHRRVLLGQGKVQMTTTG